MSCPGSTPNLCTYPLTRVCAQLYLLCWPHTCIQSMLITSSSSPRELWLPSAPLAQQKVTQRCYPPKLQLWAAQGCLGSALLRKVAHDRSLGMGHLELE